MAAQAPKELQPGEHVSWSYGAGQAHGQVVEKLTQDKKLGARVFKASPDEPKYLVKSDTSGKEAIKKPDTLHKVDGDGKGSHNAHQLKGSSKVTKSKKSNQGGRDAQKEEIGAKEKRDGLMQRSTEEEQDEAQKEETGQKVQKTGKGSAREITEKKDAENSRTKGGDEESIEEDEEVEEEGGEGDEYRPREDELKAVEDEEVVPEQVGKEVKEAKDELTDTAAGKDGSGEELEKSVVEDFIVEEGGEGEDPYKPYEPSEEEVKLAQDEEEAVAPAQVEEEAKEAREEVRDKGRGGEERKR